MARAFPQSPTYDYGADPQQGEWQALRGELVALLDQVESQVARTGRQERGYSGLADRMRELRYQVGDIDPDDRHRQALRTVKRAVDRFSERDEASFDASMSAAAPSYPPNPRDSLQSAIQQIRARQMEMGTAPAEPRPREPSPFDELARAVDGVSGRLETLELELRTQSRNQSGNVKEIADQVAQLSHVVELLAGAVGETGQVKRLEAQIAGLGKLIAQGPQLDLSALTSRLDDVSATVGRLADLQVQYAAKVDAPSALRDGMATIEEGVRNIYDRIDAIERHHALSPEMVDQLTAEMARFSEALGSAPRPENLVELVDSLTARIGQIESRHSDVGDLKADLLDLRVAVAEAMEPRFNALEMQIEALTDRVAERPADLSIGQLEAQVRQLVARMDQTGEQLTGIARMQGRQDAPDFESLADLVASRTSAAVARGSAAGDDAGVRRSIDEVNERLARLEASLAGRVPPASVEQAIPAAAPDEPAVPRVGADTMPANPADEAPLVDRPPGGIGPVRAALEAKAGTRPAAPVPPVADAPPAGPVPPRAAGLRPDFDPTTVERPPRPQSSLDAVAPTPVAAGPVFSPEPGDDVAPPVAPATTNTFIAAARRAAQRQQLSGAGKPASASRSEAGSGSLIARALQGFQAGHESAAAPAAKPTKAPKGRRKLAGDAQPREPWQPEDGNNPEPPAPPVSSIDSIGDQSAQPTLAETRSRGFFRRHSRVILLGVSIVVLSLLTLNLVNQRLADSRQAQSAAKPAAAGSAQPLSSRSTEAVPEQPAEPRVIPIVDTLATASIDPAAARSFVPASAMPPASRAFAPTAKAAAVEATERVAGLSPLAAGTATLGDAPAPATGPVQVELPPAALGPDALRRAAANGDPRAQFEIAAIYTEGRAVPEDLRTAAVWYERAAAQGFAPAQYRLANLYENGRGVDKDMEQARLWYQRAAEAGNRMSMHNLAALYAGGMLGQQAFDTAAEWFEQAAERGLKDSQFNLGMLHARGLGVPQDLDISYKWFAIAAKNGDADAAKARDDIASSLDADTVRRLNAEVEAWTPAAIDLAANFAPIGTWSDGFDPGETISSRDVVRSVQLALTHLGYDVGTPDGLAGPKTAEAIRSFERATGMSESGAINPRLLAVLGSQPV